MSILHARISIALTLLTMLGVVALIYLAFFERVVPLTRHRLIAAEGLGIGSAAEFVITREFCFSRKNEVEAHRAFRRIETQDEVPEEMYELHPVLIHFEAGCSTRSRRTPLPADIKPGQYRYMVTMKWCNDIGRCQSVRLPDILVKISGVGDRRIIRAEPVE